MYDILVKGTVNILYIVEPKHCAACTMNPHELTTVENIQSAWPAACISQLELVGS